MLENYRKKNKYKPLIRKGKVGWNPQDGKLYKELEKKFDKAIKDLNKANKELWGLKDENFYLLGMMRDVWDALAPYGDCSFCGGELLNHDMGLGICPLGAIEEVLIAQGIISIDEKEQEKGTEVKYCPSCRKNYGCPSCGGPYNDDCGGGGHK